MLLIGWKLQDKHVLVIGGGEVAKGRVQAAVKAGALVTVIAPEVVDEIKELEDQMELNRIERREVDLGKDFEIDPVSSSGRVYDMVFSAIDDRELSHKIYLECKNRRIPVNVADIPDDCDFYFGSVIERGPLQIMVSTGGTAPRLARRIRKGIENRVDELDVEEALDKIGRLRKLLREKTSGIDEITGKEKGYDKVTIATRMKWITEVCDGLTFKQMAELKDSDIEEMVMKYPLSFNEQKKEKNEAAFTATKEGEGEISQISPL